MYVNHIQPALHSDSHCLQHLTFLILKLRANGGRGLFTCTVVLDCVYMWLVEEKLGLKYVESEASLWKILSPTYSVCERRLERSFPKFDSGSDIYMELPFTDLKLKDTYRNYPHEKENLNCPILLCRKWDHIIFVIWKSDQST